MKGDDHGFDDDIPDVPKFKDIYDEHIPEMSSDREASSFHTRGAGSKFMHKSGRSGKVHDDAGNYSDGDSHDNDIFVGSIRQTDMHISYADPYRGTTKAPFPSGNLGSQLLGSKVRAAGGSDDSFTNPAGTVVNHSDSQGDDRGTLAEPLLLNSQHGASKRQLDKQQTGGSRQTFIPPQYN